jgi:hypothetical protein
MMLEELQRRNYSQTTVTAYLKTVESFAKHFHKSPDQLGPDEIRAYQVYLLQERKQGVRLLRYPVQTPVVPSVLFRASRTCIDHLPRRRVSDSWER